MDHKQISSQTGKRVLLYSGGMDSYIISKLENFDVLLYIDTKSKYSQIEKEFLKKQNIPNLIIDERLSLKDVEFDSAMVPLRNLHFISIATYYGDEIILGATAGDRSTDKDVNFAQKSMDLLNYIYQKSWWCEGRNIEINLKYKNYTKLDLVKEYIEKGGSIKDLTETSFSCYTPVDGKQCGVCKPCTRKWITLLPWEDTKELYDVDPRLYWSNSELVEAIRSNLKDKVKTRGKEDLEVLDILKNSF